MSDSSGWGPSGPSGPYWGAPGGWGWTPPPPPKPGVIPLAPLGVDHILGGAFGTMRRYAKPLFGVALAGVLALAALTLGLEVLAYLATKDRLQRMTAAPRSVDGADLRAVLIAFGSAWAVGMLVALVAGSFIQASSAATLHDAVLGRRTHFGAVWRRAWSRTPSVLGVTLLLGLFIAVPMALFILMIFAAMLAVVLNGEPFIPAAIAFLLLLLSVPPALWLLVRFSFAPAAAVLEGASPLTALRRSARLVRGAWWRTFGITLLGGLIAFIVSLVTNLPFRLAMPTPQPYTPATGTSVSVSEAYVQMLPHLGPALVLSVIASAVAQLFFMVFMPLVTSLLYIDQRIRREGLADVLFRASAVGETPGPVA
ncbi:DUF7847 domain-containing protein [Streptomyces triticiradicis]|uniref:DUF7847 domain-containing protein n=1 Tax=Streptomyces triticiradicis TaxID=2651189 RepID=A0A7J5DEI4_9ACTN|nr:hypothetical protein [Streptomyces triticiradicis]KAB1987269.1 hypothetical protein F8144_17920 [Streptomyces triticiradicis]